eukprot:3941477-Rhodomonas_salina.2
MVQFSSRGPRPAALTSRAGSSLRAATPCPVLIWRSCYSSVLLHYLPTRWEDEEVTLLLFRGEKGTCPPMLLRSAQAICGRICCYALPRQTAAICGTESGCGATRREAKGAAERRRQNPLSRYECAVLRNQMQENAVLVQIALSLPFLDFGGYGIAYGATESRPYAAADLLSHSLCCYGIDEA